MDSLTSSEALVAGGILGAGLAVIIVFALAFYILMVIADWKIFTKAGEAGWKSLIPIYNVYVFCKIIGVSFWIWLIGVPLVLGIITGIINNTDFTNVASSLYGLCIEIYLSIKLAKAFDKGVGFTIGLILFPNIFQLILGFGSSKYVGVK